MIDEKTEEAETRHLLRLDADRIREGLMDKEMRLISENIHLAQRLAESQRREQAAVKCVERIEGYEPSTNRFPLLKVQEIINEWRAPQEANDEKYLAKKVYISSFGIGFCPICHESLWQNKDESNYCFRCGQKIKW